MILLPLSLIGRVEMPAMTSFSKDVNPVKTGPHIEGGIKRSIRLNEFYQQ